MLDWLELFILLISDLMKPRSVLEAEITSLRQQVITLRRQALKQLTLRRSDRLLLTLLYRFFPEVRRAIHIVQPETLVRWHRMGFRTLWRWKSRPRGGRPKISQEMRNLIREMSIANPLWGAPRIHGELRILGIDIAQSTVAKYMVKHRGPPSQSWNTFIRNHADDIAACDFLVVPTIGLKLLFAFIVMAHGRRKLVHVGVTTHPTAAWTARQLTEAFPWEETPDTLIRDNDAIYGGVFKNRLNSMGIRDGPTALRSPWQNGYAERLIGSIRRECLDHIVIRNEGHLRRVLSAYARYYNSARTHLSLEKNSPVPRRRQACGRVFSRPHLGGLHHEYARI